MRRGTAPRASVPRTTVSGQCLPRSWWAPVAWRRDRRHPDDRDHRAPRRTPSTQHRDRPLPEWVRAHEYGDIAYEVAEGIAKITICRPERRNAFRPQTLFELADAFNRARDDSPSASSCSPARAPTPSARAVTRPSGATDGYLGDDEVAQQGIGRLNVLDLQVQIRRLPKPVVAMVAGYAIGGGHVLHLVCDLTIAADNARFGQTGPRVGSFDAGLRLLAARPDDRPEAREGGLAALPAVRRGHGARRGAS